jgi:hypothetical protein
MCKNVDSKGKVTKKTSHFSQGENVSMLGKIALACMQNFMAITKAVPKKKVIKMTYFFLLT